MPASVVPSALSSVRRAHAVGVRLRPMLCALALLCSACTAPLTGPGPARPDTDLREIGERLPPRWAGHAARPGPQPQDMAPEAAAADGWAGWDDPLLAQLQSAARQRSAGLVGAQALLEAARAERRAATAAWAPQLGLAAGVRRARPDRGTPLNTADALELRGSWEPDLFGRGTAAQAQADASLEEAGARRDGLAAALAVETAEAYVARRACEARSLLERAGWRSWQRSAADQARLADAGLLAEDQRELAGAALAAAEARALALDGQCDRLLPPLERLTGIEAATLQRWLDEQPGRLPARPQAEVDTLPAELLARRPDLRQAIARLRQAAARQDEAARARWPRVSLSGVIGSGRYDSRFTGTDSGPVWSLGPLQLTLPLLDGGAAAAVERGAQARYEAARADLLDRLQRAVQEVQTARLALADSARRLTPLWQAAEAMGRAHERARLREAAGLGDRLQTEALRRDGLQARQALVACQHEQLQAWIALHHALGGAGPAAGAGAGSGSARAPASDFPGSTGVPR